MSSKTLWRGGYFSPPLKFCNQFVGIKKGLADMEIGAIKNNIEKLEQINHVLQTNPNYMCIDCHIRMLNENIVFLKDEEGCEELVELIRANIIQYYINRLDIKIIVDSVSKLIDVLKRKVQ